MSSPAKSSDYISKDNEDGWGDEDLDIDQIGNDDISKTQLSVPMRSSGPQIPPLDTKNLTKIQQPINMMKKLDLSIKIPSEDKPPRQNLPSINIETSEAMDDAEEQS